MYLANVLGESRSSAKGRSLGDRCGGAFQVLVTLFVAPLLLDSLQGFAALVVRVAYL